MMITTDTGDLRLSLRAARRVVVKAGTNVLLAEDGLPSLGYLYSLVESLAGLRARGTEVVLVSSGAVGLGARRLGLDGRPRETHEAQACAAVGQGELMSLYQSGFTRLGIVAAQVLLTQADFGDDTRRRNLRATLNGLLALGAVPIVNENDTVSTAEIEKMRHFSDNDKLSALVAAGLGADALVILSDVDGLFTDNPHTNPDARLIRDVPRVTPEIIAMAAGKGSRGRGGMGTKLDAAAFATEAGVAVVLAPGRRHRVVEAVLDGDDVGTLFAAQPGAGETLETALEGLADE